MDAGAIKTIGKLYKMEVEDLANTIEKIPTSYPQHPIILFSDLTTDTLSNDCACPEPSGNFMAPINRDSLYFAPSDSLIIQLPNGFSLLFFTQMSRGPIVVNDAVLQRYLSFVNNCKTLQEDIDYQLAGQGVLSTIEDTQRFAKIDSLTLQSLTAWLHITNACNLDCPYCYVQKSNARMNWETGVSALRTLVNTVKQNKFKTLKLKYAGGEAILHYKLIQQLHDEAKLLTSASGIDLQEVILSNGVSIKPEFADWLNQSKVKLSVSIDGVGIIHDQQRPMKDGTPTFYRIERTLDKTLLPRGIQPNVTVTVTSLNAKYISEIVKWILERELPFSLNFYRENVLSKSRSELALEEEEVIEGMQNAYAEIEKNLPTYPFLSGLLDRVQVQPHTHTCSVGKNYVVITHTGKLSQCQMHQDYALADLTDDPEVLPLIASGPIQNISVNKKHKCQQCTFRYQCTGGCPLETYRATGRWDLQSPNCNIYQTLYPQALRLEGLRLMKIHHYL